jgi:2-polyprenyl-3-methyl-5-hydroxy-6-metoxy-1,4-benzoquinol methylase
MNSWKEKLYESYVSSGQAAARRGQSSRHLLNNYPYFRQIIKKHLPASKDLVIADIACGHGALLFCLSECGYCNVSGVDVSSEQVELARQLGVGVAVCGDMGEFLKDKENAFDVVFLMDILEHLDRCELFNLLDLVRRSLKKNGRVVIHVPNAEGLFGMRIRYGDLTHENCFTPKSMRQALCCAGFTEVQCFEDKPIIHGSKSFLRRILWDVMTAFSRLLLIAETGQCGAILSQNFLVTAHKSEGPMA